MSHFASPARPVAVVIPVYRGLAETRACLESVVQTLPADVPVIIVNDCSPEPEVTRLCRHYAVRAQVRLIEHNVNKGFVASVNEAMACEAERDVVLLNSDTEVSGDWLIRLQKAAYAEDAVATVTPFSNNATICSYPDFCAENDRLPGWTVAEMDALFRLANRGRYREIPTAVGFCMYIKRACLNEVGLFDEDAFGRGYGEENDFCERARLAGWKHVVAADCYVYHKGSVSFLGDKSELTRHAERVIEQRYPQFFASVREFVAQDPLNSERKRVTEWAVRLNKHLTGLKLWSEPGVNQQKVAMSNSENTLEISPHAAQLCDEILRSDRPRLLYISHNWGGGVEQYIQSLIGFRTANVVVMRGMGGGSVELGLYSVSGQQASITLGGFTEAQQPVWLDLINRFEFARIHLHHVHGWPPLIVDFILALRKPVDISLHDHYLFSPKYHGTDEGPRCEEPGWPQDDAAWQAALLPLVTRAERIIAPSASIRAECEKVYPQVAVQLQPHPERVESLPRLFKVVVIGALSDEKGLAVVEQVAALSQQQSPQLQITLLGYPTRPVEADIRITGDYPAQDLPRLLAAEKPDAIWFPAQVAETYSYTLSQAMATACPIVSTDLGALACRLQDYPAASLLARDASPADWLNALQTAVNYQADETGVVSDNRAAYQAWYCGPLAGLTGREQGNILALLDVMQTLPPAAKSEDKPFKSLFEFAFSTKHSGVMKELWRRLQVVPDEETEVAGMAQYRQALARYQSLAEQFETLKHDYAVQANEFNELERSSAETIARYDDNLNAARDNIAELQAQARQAQAQITHLEQERDQAREHAASLEQYANSLVQERDALLNSFSWKLTRPLRVLKRGLVKGVSLLRTLARHSIRPASYARLFSMLRRGELQHLLSRARYEVDYQEGQSQVRQQLEAQMSEQVREFQSIQDRSADLAPLVLATSAEPEVSVVIPVYGQHEVTYQCLQSIAQNPPGRPYEVIVADDCSPEAAAEALAMVEGVRFIRAESNQGFVLNMNFGAAQARGEYLVLLNNDTVVCRGAFDRLLATFSEHDKVGLVGAKLLNQDGSLQEAGGIIWRDGSGWNWGRGQNPADPRFNYVRDVDYCSGAVLAIQRSVFAGLGGFDDYYVPAYYEDTDLAFRIRQQGLRVLYQPAAEVFHLEGVSHGTDENSGVKAYQVSNGKKFYQRWQQVLASHNENGIDPENQAHRYCKGNVLVIEACMITPDQDSGSIRMLNLLRVLREEGYHVTFVADNLEYREKVVRQLNAMGIEVLFNQWAGSVRHVLRKRGQSLDAVFISRHYIASQYAAMVKALAPAAKFIFDTVDLHYVREEREAEIASDPALKAQAAVTRRKELALIDEADVTIVVSEYEKNLLAEIKPEARVEIVSNIHAHTPERPGYEEREGILFVGGFRHPPNIDAVLWYTSEVLPHLRSLLPGVVTTIIGSHMPDEIKALAAADVRVLGFVEDIEPELKKARVSIAPLRYGAGVKGKVNEAMNYGIPVVATACAVEGMHAVHGEDVLVAEDPQDFAQNIAAVYQDAQLWAKISRGGVRNLETYFSPDAARPALRRIMQG